MENLIGNQAEMKNTLSEMMSTLKGINRVDEMVDRISDIVEDTQSEQQHGKTKKMKIV